MTKKAIKKRIRKTRKTVKRGLRHQIVINPNASVRSNIIPQSQNQNSNSARSQMMANLQNPFLPIALSQTPQNVNLDAVHNMRNQNDLRQQQINDTRREKQDELARKKNLDEQERNLKKATKAAETRYKEEKEKREMAEREIERQQELAEKSKQETERYAKALADLKKTQYKGDIDLLKDQNATIQAQLAEAKMLTIERQHEIEANEQMRIKSSLQRELEKVQHENETLQKVLNSEDFKNANERRAAVQLELERARYENELLKAQNEAKAQYERERLKRMTALTPEQYRALDEQYMASINGLYQQQLLEEEGQRPGLRAKARFERLREAEIEQQRKTVDEEIKAQELGAYQTVVGPKPEITKTHKESIVKNAKKKLQAKEREKEIKRREELQATEEQKAALDAELEYLNSEEHKKQIKRNTDLKIQTLQNQRRAEDIEQASEQTRKMVESQAAFEVQRQMYPGNFSPNRKLAIVNNLQADIAKQVEDHNNQRININYKIDALRNSIGEDRFQQFLEENKDKYDGISGININQIPPELLTQFYSDLKSYANSKSITPSNTITVEDLDF